VSHVAVARPAKTNHQFGALDGLRGVAALSVVIHHYFLAPGGAPFVPSGYLAVDFFFLLSGFVISHAYESRLQAGAMSPLIFMRVRLIRLYPLYFLAAILSILFFALATLLLGATHPSRSELAVSFLFSLFFLPNLLGVHFTTAAFPLNAPSWSLACEVGINAIYAATGRWLSTPVLIAVAALGAIDLIMAPHFGGDVTATLLSGWQRAFWSFPAGILLHRAFIWRRGRPYPAVLLLALGAVLAATFALPLDSNLFRLASAMLISPAVVWFAAHVPLKGRLWSLANWSGAISYALYITHDPVGSLLMALYRHNNWSTNAANVPRLLVWTVIAVLVAWALHVVFDVPVRALMAKAARGRALPAGPQGRPGVGTARP
jgi:peptidoglycan/LPS O-acetylase OafA/YrhL